MKNLLFLVQLAMIVCLFTSCSDSTDSSDSNSPETASEKSEKMPPPHIVFVTGDEEYRSEESMPMLGKILKRELNAKISVCYALDKDGFINPNVKDNIIGLEALETADLMVLFTRFRSLPDEQLDMILNYAESGRPMVGFRTSTHAFLYKSDSSKMHLNNEWPIKVFGQKWITHHGHFDDGDKPLTDVNLYSNQKSHPILRGVKPFKAYSWLYHVEGEGHQLYGDSEPLVTGHTLRSNYAESQEFPLTNPVAWTKSYTGTSGKTARVFFTTLGHPFDFKESSMRNLAVNGMLWALGREADIPENGLNVEVENYAPNNSGFGEKYKKGIKPEM